MEAMMKKITPWIPLLIAAGYFLFLIATWQKYITSQKIVEEKIETLLSNVKESSAE